MTTSASTTPTPQSRTPAPEGPELWTVKGLISSHPTAALVVAALLASVVVMVVFVALAAKAGAVTDATTCSQWGSTNQTGQTAYGRLYLREHGPVPRWGATPLAVIGAINYGCGVAFGDDVSDTATVVQAISLTF